MSDRANPTEPVFKWLAEHGGPDWPARLVALASGLNRPVHTGRAQRLHFGKDARVSASPARLAWMLENTDRLVPRKPRNYDDLCRRVADHPGRDEALRLLRSGTRKGVPDKLLLERPARPDVLVRCETALLWVLGQRDGWLKPSTRWDLTRDALARALEALMTLADREGKRDYGLLLLHEHPLKHHEDMLLEGYRGGTWRAGWPHLDDATRRDLGHRAGTLSWQRLADEWPPLRTLKPLRDLTPS